MINDNGIIFKNRIPNKKAKNKDQIIFFDSLNKIKPTENNRQEIINVVPTTLEYLVKYEKRW
jgi:hypothetical protein